tara:strand:+ start:449 stop:1417 length:969 start_codon:yes stop_codon:yes gene_type:complete
MILNNYNFFHGIMFHHFHDDKFHKAGQGSISKDDFYNLINFIGRENILDAKIFLDKYKNNKLKENDVCFTFDDAIKCQLDIALPVLEDLKIKSFFFVHTSMYEGKPDYIEIFRYFRLNYFKDINDFYSIFFTNLKKNLKDFFGKNENLISEKKKRYPFYSIEDIKFRLVRDVLISKKEYEELMFQIMNLRKFNYKEFLSKLFFDEKDLISLDNLGHNIGLHSHSHPTLIEKLSFNDQKNEYLQNLNFIKKILNKPSSYINACSHPLGSYNADTLQILNELKIQLAFKDNMSVEKERGMKIINNSSLEIARQDHSEIIKKMKN